ncbi:hypothetical protein KC238_24195 [Mycobacteroides chelonae]|nr:hypothetical protein [Mycobacteroides chelonae]MBV0920364.1 hypothetical protein [Mycobacteroides chelonae]
MLSKPIEKGGLALGTWGTSAALLAVGIAFGYRKAPVNIPEDDPDSDSRELIRD